jgi:hypothetical protein
MVKFSKELSLGVLLVLIVIMVLKPNLLGFLYNNVLGKLVFVAAVVFLSLKHTAAGLLAVVFIAIVASMSGYHGFEGMVDGPEETSNEDKDKDKNKNKVMEGLDKKKCEGDNCDVKEGAEGQAKPVADIEKLLKKA